MEFLVKKNPVAEMRSRGWASKPFLKNWQRTIQTSSKSLGLKRSSPSHLIAYNAFKNEYPDLNIPVQHYTQVIAELIETEKLKLSKELNLPATYQDPCFLGKQNQIFDEPRKILTSIPGLEFAEMERSRQRSLCCEGGGGRMWAEGGTEGTRNGEIRIKEAVALGAKVLATCLSFLPFNP